jgi:hypothetical protein
VNSRNSKFLQVLLLGAIIGALAVKFIGNKPSHQTLPKYIKSETSRNADPSSSKAGGSAFGDNEAVVNRHPEKIIYTKHAKCRMVCRHVDDSEVREILEKGKINFAKSNDRAGSCPTYALEGRTHDGQQTRMVFAFCNATEAKVITVIDLDTDWKCDCE